MLKRRIAAAIIAAATLPGLGAVAVAASTASAHATAAAPPTYFHG